MDRIFFIANAIVLTKTVAVGVTGQKYIKHLSVRPPFPWQQTRMAPKYDK